MKFSLTLTALILIAGGIWNWNIQKRLVIVREEFEKQSAVARDLGVFIEADDLEGGAAFSTIHHRRERENTGKDVHRLSSQVIALTLEMNEAEKAGDDGNLKLREEIMSVMESLADLGSGELKIFINDMRVAGELEENMRRGILSFSIALLADHDPRGALAILTESEDFQVDRSTTGIIATALSRWAESDPMSALDWVKKNPDKFAESSSTDINKAIIKGAATQNPALAFTLLAEMDPDMKSGIAGQIAEVARTNQDRTVLLEALRHQLSTMGDSVEASRLRDSVLGNLRGLVDQGNFDAASTWLSDSSMSSDEISSFSSVLQYGSVKGESGDWIGWLAENAPSKVVSERVPQMMAEWTRQDFKSAGEWLLGAPNDAAKAPAVRAYAETVAAYEPKAAEQWALTLPAGEQRKATLQSIKNSWPGDDPAGKADFAKRHGLDGN